MEDEGKAALDSDSVTKNEESLSETTIEPSANKEETSQASSVEHTESKDATSEENQNKNQKKAEPEIKNNDKSTKDTTERSSKKHSTVKPKSKPAVTDKEKKEKRVGVTEKGHRGKATKKPHQKVGGGQLAVSSTKHKHDSMQNDDSSSYEEHKKQKYSLRKNTSGSSHQKISLATSANPGKKNQPFKYYVPKNVCIYAFKHFIF